MEHIERHPRTTPSTMPNGVPILADEGAVAALIGAAAGERFLSYREDYRGCTVWTDDTPEEPAGGAEDDLEDGLDRILARSKVWFVGEGKPDAEPKDVGRPIRGFRVLALAEPRVAMRLARRARQHHWGDDPAAPLTLSKIDSAYVSSAHPKAVVPDPKAVAPGWLYGSGASGPYTGYSIKFPTDAPRDIAEIRFHLAGGFDWGHSWPRRGGGIDARRLLRFLTESWTTIGADFLIDGTRAERGRPRLVDFRAGLDRPDLPRAEIVLDGPRIIARTARGNRDFGAESVMTVEALAGLGNAIATHFQRINPDDVDAANWEAERPKVDVWPERCEFRELPDGTISEATQAESLAEAAYYARRIGVDPEVFIRAALQADVEQMRFALRERPDEPQHPSVTSPPADLRSRANLEAEIARLAPLTRQAAHSVIENAIHGAAIEARAIVYYRHWPKRGPANIGSRLADGGNEVRRPDFGAGGA